MGARGELFTTEVFLDGRSYFFNVKENRTGDVFLQVVESKSRDGASPDRHQIAIFAEDMQKFLQGMDKSLEFIEKDRKAKQKAAKEKRAQKDAYYSAKANGTGDTKNKKYRVKSTRGAEVSQRQDDGIKRTGKVHIASKIPTDSTTPSNE
ncbi:MAG: PUR family DNA/RNA-binding protein [Treponema sp.]|nr:PUR family DNA/RNA-binding protein [Treponema sp.]